ncbi:hypothetical protein [Brochothrix thermosphacta]|uniref:Uncharacterized protein n=2 Tax=Brochothrix thermosphacta TaxID=2756 RepID=A0A1D2JQL1_BROTH|nr:hypothetical protein [Brochothrix thermosphacta]ATF27123.1 hypothetical protein CNY62_12515 [Brochothrix thermosphacta]ATH86482.1 hypothetical protein CPF12_12205 [Brochothrix thermosphacta]EUJ36137.1 hypothetical protein BTHER_07456 [Brochothrix thermosphacta DSM 20171 = FSL F6-1036]ODJ47739.1 hypothetical protein BFR38_06855 [Brochothrix thermosphacta]ODJ50446.1 hypothetical protein BFR34_03060 [Brochothrix thermosphacta DSM 20171 = FSL F6-1036]
MFSIFVSMIDIVIITATVYLLLKFFNKDTTADKQRAIAIIITALVFIYALLHFLNSTILFS